MYTFLKKPENMSLRYGLMKQFYEVISGKQYIKSKKNPKTHLEKLDNKHFVNCVRVTTILAKELNLVVQDAEKSINSADIVLIDMMK